MSQEVEDFSTGPDFKSQSANVIPLSWVGNTTLRVLLILYDVMKSIILTQQASLPERLWVLRKRSDNKEHRGRIWVTWENKWIWFWRRLNLTSLKGIQGQFTSREKMQI
jgi:hypothetical protein